MMSNILGSKKLYRVPEEGKVKGVCAGLAHYIATSIARSTGVSARQRRTATATG